MVYKVVWDRLGPSAPRDLLISAIVERSMAVVYTPGDRTVPRWGGCRLLAFDNQAAAEHFGRTVGLRGTEVWKALATDSRWCPYLHRLGMHENYGILRRWWARFNDGSLFNRPDNVVYDDRIEHDAPHATVACQDIQLIERVWPPR